MARVWIEDRTTHNSYRQAVSKAKVARKNPPGRWRVRWYGPDGKPKAKTFARKPQAEAYVRELEGRLTDGTYRDPAASKILFVDIAEKWAKTLTDLKPSTRETYLDTLRVHVSPKWETHALHSIRWEDVAEWINHLAEKGGRRGRPLSPGRVRKIHLVLSLVLGHAVRSNRLVVNPAADVPLPRIVEKDHVYLTHAEVQRLADAAGPYRLLILVLAYTGLRWGEVAALTVGAVDLRTRRIHVRQAYSKTKKGLHLGTPKTHEKRRVPILGSLAEELRPLVDGRKPDALLFTAPRGGPLYGDNFRTRFFNPAVKAAGLDDRGVTPHALRHTAASLSIAAGADVKVVQTMLGHASATMTLDRYGHLFPDRLDEVARRLDDARARHDTLRRLAAAFGRRLERLDTERPGAMCTECVPAPGTKITKGLTQAA